MKLFSLLGFLSIFSFLMSNVPVVRATEGLHRLNEVEAAVDGKENTQVSSDFEWEEIGTGSGSGGGISNNDGKSRYPTIAIAPDDTIYVVWQDDSDGDYEIYVQHWNGTLWGEVGLGSATGGGISDNESESLHPDIAATSDGTLYVVWEDTSNNIPQIYVRRWNGANWEEVGPSSATTDGVSNNTSESHHPAIAIAPDGVPYIAWHDYTEGAEKQIYVRRWNGTAWEEVGAGSASGGGVSNNPGRSWYADIAVALDGMPYVAWHDHSNGNAEIYVRRWNGTAWEEIGAGSASFGGISNNNLDSWAATIAVAPDGTPYVAWHDHSNGMAAEIYVRRWNGTAWEEVGAGSAKIGGISNNASDSKYPSLAIAPNNIPYIAWHDSSSGDAEIYVRRWNGNSWVEVGIQSAKGGGISNNSGNSRHPSIMISRDGTPYITWQDDSSGDNEIYMQRGLPQLPDLVITDIWNEGKKIWYQVKNNGGTVAFKGHLTQLSIENQPQAESKTNVDLATDTRLTNPFDYTWECTPPTDTVKICADSQNYIPEGDENNNCREEIWLCDVTPPQIIAKPTVSEVTTNAVTISWQTDEDSDSVVRYGNKGGDYAQEKREELLTQEHRIILTDLEPGTAYHYLIQSTDATGNAKVSQVGLFETQPVPDGEPPSLSNLAVTRGAGDLEYYEISVSASDNSNVERLEFYLDGKLIDVDYAPTLSHKTVLVPAALGLSRAGFYEQSHTIEVKAFDQSGLSSTLQTSFSPTYEYQKMDLHILSPTPNYVVHINGDTVPPGTEVFIEAQGIEYEWNWELDGGCPENWDWDPDLCQVHADAVAQGVSSIEFYINDVLVHTSHRSDPDDMLHNYSWDVSGLAPDKYTLTAKAIASDGGHKEVKHTINIVNAAPNINIQRKVIWDVVAFKVILTVENQETATSSAQLIDIQDNIVGFQAVAESTESYHIVTDYTHDTKGCDVEIEFPTDITLDPGQSFSVEYMIIPILYDGHNQHIQRSIGESDVIVSYEVFGKLTQEKFPRPCDRAHTPTLSLFKYLPLSWAVQLAFANSDYVIVTNPKKLFNFNTSSTVNQLLSTMADLAYLKKGVLGYLHYDDRTILDQLLTPDGDWAKQLHSDFSTAGGGYLLIVGETEIVPSWKEVGFNRKWSDGDVTDEVDITDHPYANTTGNGAPELIVGRIIGNSAVALAKPLQASINVHEGVPGYNFDRSHALLVSGTGSGQDKFVDNVNDIEDILQPEFSVSKLHWKDYLIRSSFHHDYTKYDKLAAGDVMGGIEAEILTAKDDNHRVYIYSADGTLLNDFKSEYTKYDGFVVEDIQGDSKAEILIAKDEDKRVYIYNALGKLIADFECVYTKWDGFAVGNVMGNANNEIIIGRDDDDKIYIYATDGTLIKITKLPNDYTPYDKLAVGDVKGDSMEEILVARDDDGEIFIYDFNGNELIKLHSDSRYPQKKNPNDVYYSKHDGFVVGNVIRGGFQEDILVARDNDHMVYITNNTFSSRLSYYSYFTKYDGFATGNVDSNGAEEILVARDNDKTINIEDLAYGERMHNALIPLIPNQDVIFYFGHGNGRVWGSGLQTRNFSLNFADATPFVFAPSCLTGNYKNSYSIAEAFLDRGAAVYIGSTQVSPSSQNSEVGERFFKGWDTSESSGKAFYDLERDRWSHGDWWRFWIWEYNLYGDPKFGATSSSSAQATFEQNVIQAPLANLEIEIPDYEITTDEGLDYVEIPGGDMLLEEGEYQIPYWSVTINYPKGQKIQKVILVDRSGLVTNTGLTIPTTTMMIDCSECAETQSRQILSSTQSQSWTPALEDRYRWTILENPEGTTTLVVILYPFYYNPLTTDIKFYKNYSLDIQTISTTVEIDALITDQRAYTQGDKVLIDLRLNNTGDAQDVIVDAVVKADNSGEVVDGLLLRNLHNLTGSASLSMQWDSRGFGAGYYSIEIEVRDDAGNILDTATRQFRLGIVSGEVTAFTVTPLISGTLVLDNMVDISLVFSNTGTVPITGTAVIKIEDEDGTSVETLNHDIVNLAPDSEMTINKTWDYSEAAAGSYRILGYVLYDGKATEPKRIDFKITASSSLYLPLILRHTSAPQSLQANFTASPISGIAPLTVTFTNTTMGSYAASLWNFGDGITSTLHHLVHTYTAVGAYTVTLTVNKVKGSLVLLDDDTSTLTRTNYIYVYTATPTSSITAYYPIATIASDKPLHRLAGRQRRG